MAMTSNEIQAYANRHGLSFYEACSELGRRRSRRALTRKKAGRVKPNPRKDIGYDELLKRRPDLRAEAEEEERVGWWNQ